MTEMTAPVRAHMTSISPVWLEWREQLPDVLQRCVSAWGLELGQPLARRVTSAVYAVRVRGRDAVLKVALPGEHLSHQAHILQAAGGVGYVHLFDRDDDNGALLLEPLGASLEAKAADLYRELPAALALATLNEAEWVKPVVGSLKEAWQLPHELVRTPDDDTYKAAQLRELIVRLADELGVREQHSDAIARALLYADQRLSARTASLHVVCHGDPHLGNLLEVHSPRPGAPEGYVWVDPDGFLCEAEYDLGVTLRGINRMLLAADDPVVRLRGWCAMLADATGTDAEAIWQWAFIERVGTGLYLMDQGWPERGRPFLDAASWVIGRKRSQPSSASF